MEKRDLAYCMEPETEAEAMEWLEDEPVWIQPEPEIEYPNLDYALAQGLISEADIADLFKSNLAEIFEVRLDHIKERLEMSRRYDERDWRLYNTLKYIRREPVTDWIYSNKRLTDLDEAL